MNLFSIATRRIDAIQTALSRSIAVVLLFAAGSVQAENTVSYYRENAGERIDRVLRCRDGAEDPASLGCRNANNAQLLDVRSAGRFGDYAAIAGWDVSAADGKTPQALAFKAARKVRENGQRNACIALRSEEEPSKPVAKKVLQTALAEKLLEPVSGKAHVYRTTPRGDEFLTSQGTHTQQGFFCPFNLQFAEAPKLLDSQDLTAKYRGKKTTTGYVVKKLLVQKVAFELTTTGSSVWFFRKVVPAAFGMTGQVVASIVVADYEGLPSEQFAGGVYEVDGVLAAGPSLEKLLDNFK